MAEKKIIKAIKSLDKNEVKSFDLFINSPFFNKNKDLIKVYDFLKKFAKLNNKKEGLETFIIKRWNVKNNNKKLSNASLIKHLSNIYQLFLKFIAQSQFQNDAFNSKFELLNYYLINYKKDEFEKQYLHIKTLLTACKEDISKYEKLHMLEESVWIFNTTYLDDRTNDCNLKVKMDCFREYYLLKRFNESVTDLNRINSTNVEINKKSYIELIEIYNNGNFNDKPLFKAWYLALIIVAEKGESKEAINSFYDFQEHLKIYASTFANSQAFNFYTILRNQHRYICQDTNQQYQFLFNLYKEQMLNQTLYNDGKLYYQILKNLVSVCIKLKEYIWLFNFMENHKNKIFPVKIGKDVYQFNMARIYFSKKEFDKADELLANSKVKDIFYKLSTKRLRLMLYFEQQEWNLLDSNIERFRKYLTRGKAKEIIVQRKVYEENFVLYIKKILRIQIDVNRNFNKITKIKNEFSQLEKVAERNWLSEKIEETLALVKNSSIVV